MMYQTRILMLFIVFGVSPLFAVPVLAQGGWDVWTVYLRDGSQQSAAPVWALDKKVLRRGFSSEGTGEGEPVQRSLISHMSSSLRNSDYRGTRPQDFVVPPLPEGVFQKDLVVMDTGKRIFGAVLIRAGKGASGQENRYRPVLVQNGIEIDLTSVAHIKFAAPKSGSGRKKARP